MSDEEVRDTISEGAQNLNEYLKLGLGQDNLLKTGGYNKHTKKDKINKTNLTKFGNRMKKLTREQNSLILNYNEAEFNTEPRQFD